jgi:HAMP domain-containing protein
VPPTRLLKTSTFRLTVGYFGLFCLSALAVLLIVYLMSARFMDQQTREEIDSDLGALRAFYKDGGQGSLEAAVEQRAVMEPGRKAIYGLFDEAGDYLVGNIIDMPAGRPSADGEVIRFEVDVYVLEGFTRSRKHEAVAKLMLIEDVGTLVVGRDVRDKALALRYLLLAIGIGTACMLVLGLLCGHVMSRWTLGRIERVNRTTAGIVAGDLSRRIELSGADDEFDELARHLNAMLERIDRLLAGMRQVTDDIAHDLRTPLTRMRSRIELALMSESAGSRDARPARGDAAGRRRAHRDLQRPAAASPGRGGHAARRVGGRRPGGAGPRRPRALRAAGRGEGIALELSRDPAAAVETIGNGQLLAQAIAEPRRQRDQAHARRRPARVRTAWARAASGSRRRARHPRRPARAGEAALREARRGPLLVPARPRPEPRRRGAKLHEGRLDLLDNEPGLGRPELPPVPAAATDERPASPTAARRKHRCTAAGRCRVTCPGFNDSLRLPRRRSTSRRRRPMLRPVERFAVNVPPLPPRQARPAGGGGLLRPVLAMAALGALIGLLLPAT